ncbi:hypothetical protein MKW98_022994 [Papaver atlanticum]|uniref:Uncharacterized protein n=1 Tax=Papaver atlanticum TaxID=357466 RepID=A0AAD4T7M3_9MAGN|nr:hypothetical protein MKW98_022994 [Papaver atlanticum]
MMLYQIKPQSAKFDFNSHEESLKLIVHRCWGSSYLWACCKDIFWQQLARTISFVWEEPIWKSSIVFRLDS